MILRIPRTGHGQKKPWVAAITGKDRQYGLAREFVAPVRDGADNLYQLDRGLYEVCDPSREIPRYFLSVDPDEEITGEELLAKLCKANKDIDDKIVRFNAEGGFTQN